MTIEYDLTLDDLAAYQIYGLDEARARNRDIGGIGGGWLSDPAVRTMIVVALLGLAVLPNVLDDSARGFVLGIGIGIVLVTIANRWSERELRTTLFWRRYFERVHQREGTAGVLGMHRMTLTPEGIRETAPHQDVRFEWAAIGRIVTQGQHAFIHVPGAGAFIVPKRAFPDEAQFWQFVSLAREYRGKEIDDSPTTAPNSAFPVMPKANAPPA